MDPNAGTHAHEQLIAFCHADFGEETSQLS
jgi:hypothetical protein